MIRKSNVPSKCELGDVHTAPRLRPITMKQAPHPGSFPHLLPVLPLPNPGTLNDLAVSQYCSFICEILSIKVLKNLAPQFTEEMMSPGISVTIIGTSAENRDGVEEKHCSC